MKQNQSTEKQKTQVVLFDEEVKEFAFAGGLFQESLEREQKKRKKILSLFSPLLSVAFLCLTRKQAGTASSLDLPLGHLGEEPSSHDDGDVGDVSLAEDLADASLGEVEQRSLVVGGFSGLGEDVLAEDAPQLVHVHDLSEGSVLFHVEVSHTDLTEVTGVELIEQNSVVVLATSVTSATRVASVLADSAVTG